MNLEELAIKTGQRTPSSAQAVIKAQNTPDTPNAQQVEQTQAEDIKARCLALFGTLSTAAELRTLRAIYDMYSRYLKYPPATDADWAALSDEMTIYSNSASLQLQTLIKQAFEDIERRTLRPET